MSVLPPGTILQLEYLRDRLKRLSPGYFIEIGPGGGEITNLLLAFGWRGCSYDLEPRTVEKLQDRFSSAILEGRYQPINADYLALPESGQRADLIISCMVMEHLNGQLEMRFMQRSRQLLSKRGLLVGLVPGRPEAWGIEDDIAGHHRRYTVEALYTLAGKTGWTIRHISGLTFPVSNLLLPISNFLVRRAEAGKLELSDLEKTKASGIRTVWFKTRFPPILALFLNRHTMLPLHWLQKFFGRSRRALVIYFEAVPSTVGRINS